MYCLKCGRETADSQVFCDGCLETMEKYPVRPDTPVQLPRRSTADQARKPGARKRSPSPEERVALLKKLLRRMSVCAAVLLMVLCLAIALLVRELYADRPDDTPGRNYSIDTSQTED